MKRDERQKVSVLANPLIDPTKDEQKELIMRAGNKSKFLVAAFIAAFVLMIGVVPAHADTRTFSLNFVFSGDLPDSTAPYGTAQFQDLASCTPACPANTVKLVLTGSLEDSSEFITEWDFNSSALNLVFGTSTCSGCALKVTGSDDGINPPDGVADQYKADGGPYFDFGFIFATSNSDRFDGTDVFTILLTRTSGTLTVANFEGTGVGGDKGTYHTAAHIQGITPNCSGWVGDAASAGSLSDVNGCGETVPEPSSLLLLGAGLATLGSMGLFRRRG